MKLQKIAVLVLLFGCATLQSMSLFTKRAAPLVLRNYELLFKRHVSQKAFKRSVKQAFKEEDWNKNWHNFPYAASAVKDIFNMRNTSPKEFSFIIKPTINWEYCFAFNTFYYRQEDIAEFDDTLQRQALGHTEKKRLYWNIMKDGMTTKQQHVLLIKGIIGHELQHAFDDALALSALNNSCEKFNIHRKNLSFDEERQNEIRADKGASIDSKILRAGAKLFQVDYDMRKAFYDSIWKDPNQKEDAHPHPLERAKYLLEAAHAQEVINKKYNAAVHCIRTKKHRERQFNEVLDATKKMTL